VWTVPSLCRGQVVATVHSAMKSAELMGSSSASSTRCTAAGRSCSWKTIRTT